jgi:UDP-N-acetylglucosamine--N-acetylmuramyl-(pentapeptide) pyrophosphoryl-undecaprenol N-acetylglucosamine transferase
MIPALRPADLLWIGSHGGFEAELVAPTGIRLVVLGSGGLRGIRLDKRVRHTVQIVRSISQAREVIRKFKPDVVFATGGYACVPVTLAARMERVPVLIYLPDIVPGLAIRHLGRFAAKIAVTSEESYQHLHPDKVVVTGYPVREALFELNKAQAQETLGLQRGEKTLLVFGGSRGARSINQALVAGLRELLPACQIIHVSGRLDAEWVAGAARSLPETHKARYHHYAFLDEMPEALVAADLAVARSGAATLGEFPAVGLPAVLVPYPYSGQHQEPNARYMARNGAAQVLADAQLEQKLVPTILRLLDDAEALADMRESALAMARPDAAEAIAEQLWMVASHNTARQAGVTP